MRIAVLLCAGRRSVVMLAYGAHEERHLRRRDLVETFAVGQYGAFPEIVHSVIVDKTNSQWSHPARRQSLQYMPQGSICLISVSNASTDFVSAIFYTFFP